MRFWIAMIGAVVAFAAWVAEFSGRCSLSAAIVVTLMWLAWLWLGFGDPSVIDSTACGPYLRSMEKREGSGVGNQESGDAHHAERDDYSGLRRRDADFYHDVENSGNWVPDRTKGGLL